MTIAMKPSTSTGPQLVVDPAAITVLAALEMSIIAATVIASATIAITSANNVNQLSAGDIASSATAAAASLLLCAPLSVAATATSSEFNHELARGNVVKGAGTRTCSIITRAAKTSLHEYFEGVNWR
jgi:hypothetical protein